MATPVTSSNFGSLLWPGLNAVYQQAYNEHPTEWTDLFDSNRSSKRYEEDVGSSWFGLASVKPEGAPLEYDDATQGFKDRYENKTYAKGFMVTREMVEDNQYNEINMRARSLAFAMNQTKENVGANIFNNAYSGSGVTYGDGKTLIATDHPRVRGGTWSNQLSTNADISEAALEQAAIDIMKFTDERGLKIAVRPMSLHLPPDLVFEAERILNSPLQNDTANNAINALFSMGKFPNGIKVNHYFTDTDAWFIRTNIPDGLKYFTRRGMEFGQDNDFDTESARYKATERYSFGASDKRSVFGSQGS